MLIAFSPRVENVLSTSIVVSMVSLRNTYNILRILWQIRNTGRNNSLKSANNNILIFILSSGKQNTMKNLKWHKIQLKNISVLKNWKNYSWELHFLLPYDIKSSKINGYEHLVREREEKTHYLYEENHLSFYYETYLKKIQCKIFLFGEENKKKYCNGERIKNGSHFVCC